MGRNAIRCEYITYKNSISSTKIAEGSIREWYCYQDTEELKQILHLMGDITEGYALDWFKNNVPEVDLLPDNFLEEAWREKIENFIRIHQIQLEESDSSIAKLDEILRGKVSREEMYAVSFCFGEIIRKQFGADWDFSEETGPYIRNIAGDYNYVRKPFALVLAVVSDPFENSLQEYFHIIRDIVDRLK